ncbi:hypothetical protein CQW23_06184 [Capsicum baccatum]|uniref:Uncharacterized protein n=1 Tax=Capsicum baccatum TaxID=33114 RepID=A0A2G2X2K8_CAPBA|nr:hypothetical protein CQW23_06184 [Capsicum baccatum]
MLFFLALQSVQILSDPKVINGIKIELLGATTIRRKIILEGGLVAVDDGSGAAVRANDSSLTFFEIKSHYDYDHTGCTDFSSDFATSSKCFACKFQDCKVDVTIGATTKNHNITVDNPSTASKKRRKSGACQFGRTEDYPFEGFNILDEDPKKLTQLINDYSEWIADGLLKHHADRDCGLFITAYGEYLSDGLQVSNDGLDAGLLCKKYAALLWKYGEAKALKPYTSNIKDP